MKLDAAVYERELEQARLRLATFDESKHPRVHGRFVKVAARLKEMADAATDKNASEHSAVRMAEQLVRGTGPKANPKWDMPYHAEQLSRNLRAITWGPNAKEMNGLADQVDKARAEDYDYHVGQLRSQMAGETHYTPESLAQVRDMGQAQRDAQDSERVTVKIPSGSEMSLTHRQAHHLKRGRPNVQLGEHASSAVPDPSDHYNKLASISHMSGKLPEGFKLKKVTTKPDAYDLRRVESLSAVHAPDGTLLGYVGKVPYSGERVMSGRIQVGTVGAGKRWQGFDEKGKSVGVSTYANRNRFDGLRALGRYHPKHGKDR